MSLLHKRMSSLLKNIFFAAALALILWFGYRVFFSGDAAIPGLDAQVVSEASRDSQQFLKTLQQLRGIEFRQEIFGDGRFRSFTDQRQPILAEPVGRQNPFAPIGQ